MKEQKDHPHEMHSVAHFLLVAFKIITSSFGNTTSIIHMPSGELHNPLVYHRLPYEFCCVGGIE